MFNEAKILRISQSELCFFIKKNYIFAKITKDMEAQDELIRIIRNKIDNQSSMNDCIAIALNISYDAAHRRVSGKSKFTIDETIELAKYYNISLDQLFFKKSQIIVSKTIEIQTQKDMFEYFSNSAKNINTLSQNPETQLFYSAKDIPLFYFMDGTIMSKFKAFVWLNLLNSNFSDLTFDNFVIQEPFLEVMTQLQKSYQNINVHEVWNDTSINSSLQQILYFYQSGKLSYHAAIELFADLKRILEKIKNNCNNSSSKVSIYYNELILLNNNLLFKNQNQLTMFVPYTLLGYFITDDNEACKNVEKFFNQQISNSIPLNHTGMREQHQFFNKMYRKIDYFRSQLNFEVDEI
jgi:BetR domain